MGYYWAGFDIIGVDIVDQPNYPFTFVKADALRVVADTEFLREFAVVHASPPCQFGTAYKRRQTNPVRESPNLIPEVRRGLRRANVMYVIENLWVNRDHLRDPVMYCGSSFGLDVQRHRAFETNCLIQAPACDHGWQTPRFPPAGNRENLRSTVEIGVGRIPMEVQRKAMGIEWMYRRELTEAIPPAYTEDIGRQLMRFCYD